MMLVAVDFLPEVKCDPKLAVSLVHVFPHGSFIIFLLSTRPFTSTR